MLSVLLFTVHGRHRVSGVRFLWVPSFRFGMYGGVKFALWCKRQERERERTYGGVDETAVGEKGEEACRPRR